MQVQAEHRVPQWMGGEIGLSTQHGGPARAQKGKIGYLFFMFFHCLAKCTKYGKINCQKVIFREKKIFEKPHCRAKLGEKKSKKKILRMGLPGTQNLS